MQGHAGENPLGETMAPSQQLVSLHVLWRKKQKKKNGDLE